MGHLVITIEAYVGSTELGRLEMTFTAAFTCRIVRTGGKGGTAGKRGAKLFDVDEAFSSVQAPIPNMCCQSILPLPYVRRVRRA